MIYVDMQRIFHEFPHHNSFHVNREPLGKASAARGEVSGESLGKAMVLLTKIGYDVI